MCSEESRRLCEYCLQRCCHAPSLCLTTYAEVQITKFQSILAFAQKNVLEHSEKRSSPVPIPQKPHQQQQQSPFCGNIKRKRLVVPFQSIIDLTQQKDDDADNEMSEEEILDSGNLRQPVPTVHLPVPAAPRIDPVPLHCTPEPPHFSLELQDYDLNDFHCGGFSRSPSPIYLALESEFFDTLLFSEA